jgi:hypothetical protein
MMAIIPITGSKVLTLPSIIPDGDVDPLNLIYQLENNITADLQLIKKEINGRISFGAPETSEPSSNIQGVWVTKTITDNTTTTNSTAYTFTHGLDRGVVTIASPIASPTTTTYLPNVRWFLGAVTYGDKTGTAAPPAAITSAVHVDLRFNVRDTVTANEIDLRIGLTGLDPSTADLTLDVFFIPAEE